MSLDDLVSVTIEADSTAPSRPSFGTILCLVGKTPALFSASTTTVVKAITDMTAMGFTSADPAYKLVSRIFSQKTRPKVVKLWKRTLAPMLMSVDLKVLSAGDGAHLKVSVNGTDYDITLDGTTGATPSSAATALEAAIAADTDLDTSVTTDTVTIALAGAEPTMDGVLFQVANWSANISFQNTSDYSTAASTNTVADDLDAALLADTDWYGLQLDSNSKVEIADAAAWVETNKRLFIPTTNDTECTDSSDTDDCMYVAQAAEQVRTGILYNGNDTFSYAGAAWMGGRFPFQPGSYTWAFKSLAGVAPDPLTPTQQNAIEEKNGNSYTTVASVNITLPGKTAGGEWIDITQFIDWLRSEIQVRVFGRMVNLPKIPYTDLGVDIIVAEINGALQAGVRAGGLDAGDGKDIAAPEVTAPKVADVDVIDRANRHLPDVKFSGRLAGAIHDLTINGTLSV